ncbi:MAG: TonB-dependent receptor [Burkholderiales bacterium]|nr:TonB-dependent receptor [Burkholderiales bacterium]
MSSHKSLLPCALLAAAITFTQPTAAQNQAAAPSVKQDSDKTKTQEIEVKAKSEVENQRRDAAAKSIVSNADLIRYGDTNITEAMKRVPGVIVVKGVMQLPGLNSGYTQILVDGEPPRGISINDIPMQSIERVEIYRLGSAEFSSQGVAGTINIILKKVPQSKQNNLTLALSHETKTTPQISWTSSDKWDNWSYSITASARQYVSSSLGDSHTYERDLKNEPVREYSRADKSEYPIQSFSINPVIQYRKPDGFNLKVTSHLLTSDGKNTARETYTFQKGDPLPYPHIRRNNQLQDVNSGTTIKLLDKLGEATKLDFSINLSGRRSNFRDKDSNFDLQEHLLFARQVYLHELENRVATSLKLTAPSNEEHDIVGGITLSSVNNRNERNQELTVINTPPELIGDSVKHQATHSVVNNYAAFVQDEWKFRKESSAYFGLRWENVNVSSEGSEQIAAQNTSSVWSPIIQTLWQLNSENSDRLRVGVSRTFKAPGNFFLVHPRFVLPNNSEQNPSVRGNPMLKPELAWSFEASYEHNDAQEFAYSVKAIVREITDLHRMQAKIIDQFWWRQVVNAGDAISKRVDLNIQYLINDFLHTAQSI